MHRTGRTRLAIDCRRSISCGKDQEKCAVMADVRLDALLHCHVVSDWFAKREKKINHTQEDETRDQVSGGEGGDQSLETVSLNMHHPFSASPFADHAFM